MLPDTLAPVGQSRKNPVTDGAQPLVPAGGSTPGVAHRHTPMPKGIFIAMVACRLPAVDGLHVISHYGIGACGGLCTGGTAAAAASRPWDDATAAGGDWGGPDVAADLAPLTCSSAEGRRNRDRGARRLSAAPDLLPPRMPAHGDALQRDGSRLRRILARTSQIVGAPVPPSATPDAEGKWRISLDEGDFVAVASPLARISVSHVAPTFLCPMPGRERPTSGPGPAMLASPQALAK